MKEIREALVLKRFRFAILICALSAGAISLSAADLSQAEDLYKHTNYTGSLALLDKSSTDASVWFLAGRDYFMLGDFKKAAEHLERAVAAQPANSEYVDWLGRAYGKRAETSNPLIAPGLAVKARQAFERSVRLDPKNSDALSDLFDFYLNAPGLLGGGYEKARVTADQIAAIDPPEGYFVKSKLAEKKKEYSTAEERLRQAVAVAPHEVGHMIALAKLLATEGRLRESDAVLAAAQDVNPNAPRIWFERADILIKQKRDLQEARALLQKYMRAPITVDDPPKEEAMRLLRQVGGA
ncbi:MAG: tetratricopeptide repeat protein [Acidobacteriaceae bacterium]|nr:tetratricopeptide repeat protein [Acidobacteriaceae bacterium]